jgi:hypothetical protein
MLAATMGVDMNSLRECLESPRFTGRAVVALASDPNAMARTGRAFIVAEVALDYGFTDINGNQPPVIRDPAELEKMAGVSGKIE